MKRRKLILIGGLSLVAMPIAALTPPYISFEPATGPVGLYQARVRTTTKVIHYMSESPIPVVELVTVPIGEHEFWIDVRAVEADGDTGPWSEPHYTNPDCDENGGVGISDFVKCVRGISEFATLVEHWGHKTIWDEGLGLRRCER